MAVCLTSGGQFHIQLLGVVSVGAFVFGTTWILWRVMAWTLGVRVSHQVEQLGQDVGELGMEAYPEFVLMPEDFEED